MNKVLDTNQIRQAISDNLRRLLRARGMTQAELARRIFGEAGDSAKNQISRWVLGKNAPTAADLLNLAEALQVTAEDIGRPKISKKSA